MKAPVPTGDAERQRAEEKLRESERKFSILFEKAPFAAALSRLPEGVIVDVNEAFERMYGYFRQEVIGRTSLELDLYPTAAREVMIAEFQARGCVRQVELSLRAKSGEARVALVNSDLVDIGGRKYILTTSQDVTAARRAEAERERLQESLRRSEVMAAIGALVAGIAHEVRNPLFGIAATLDAFEARFATQEGCRQYLRVLRGEVDRLNQLMRDLLAYGKPPALAPGPLAPVVAAAVGHCGALARDAGVQITTRLSASLPPIAMDGKRLQQVFQNLLQNAIEHSPRGAAVALEAEQVSENGTSCVQCTVEDSGPGFSPEDLPRVFEPFFSRRKGGTGLGLAIVRHIVEAHGGTVWVANRPEGGAVVTVRLPAK